MHESETEADTRANRIDPALKAAGWGTVPGSRIRREVICPGRILPGGKRGTSLAADYVLIHRDRKLAVIEAKRAGIGHTEGVAQAKDYAARLKTPFAYATNGLKWYGMDVRPGFGTEGDITPFPTPDELWTKAFPAPNPWRERFGAVPFETDGGKWELRYYQHNAVNAVLEAVAGGRKRILLTLATGTGKTSIAFQIAWKLFHSHWTLPGDQARRPRILFLADRNILADQAYNAFSAFPPGALARIDPDALRKTGKAPKNANVFFTIFQTFMTGENDPVFQAYPKDFFDLIVVDECHRGGANDESQWRDILDHFSPAVQLGLTATPKRNQNADTYAYFGEPVYTYALRDGIEDGFLTPFKVRQMASTMDSYTFVGDDDVEAGEVEQGQHFEEGDFNRVVIIPERELSRVKQFMKQIDQRQKTLVFCASQPHAAMVRDFINQVKASPSPDYCHRVTAEDGELGEQHLRAFQDNDKTIPTILTTSQKLSTGVDARNVRHIVLMRPIRSMIEFKQIIGRGTRTYDGKHFFTIWDFVRAHELFRDPAWDGEPEPPDDGPQAPKGNGGDEPPPPEPPGDDPGDDDEEDGAREKIVIRLADGKERAIQYIATTTYWDADGKPISAAQFLERLFGDLSSLLADEDQLRTLWSNPATRSHLLQQLQEIGYDEEKLQAVQQLVDAPQSDFYDVLAYIRFSTPPATRHDRAEGVRQGDLATMDGELKQFLLGILQAYEKDGEGELDPKKLADFLTVRYGGVNEGMSRLGQPAAILDAFRRMQAGLYSWVRPGQ